MRGLSITGGSYIRYDNNEVIIQRWPKTMNEHVESCARLRSVEWPKPKN